MDRRGFMMFAAMVMSFLDYEEKLESSINVYDNQVEFDGVVVQTNCLVDNFNNSGKCEQELAAECRMESII